MIGLKKPSRIARCTWGWNTHCDVYCEGHRSRGSGSSTWGWVKSSITVRSSQRKGTAFAVKGATCQAVSSK